MITQLLKTNKSVLRQIFFTLILHLKQQRMDLYVTIATEFYENTKTWNILKAKFTREIHKTSAKKY